MKREPQRTCVGCREVFPQKELLRIAATADSGPVLDFRQKKPGRGAYLCYQASCVAQARKRQSLQRALKCPVPENIWIEIDRAVETAGKGED